LPSSHIRNSVAGLPDFSWRNIPKRGKLYQNTTKYTKGQQTIPNDYKIYQKFLILGLPKKIFFFNFWFENIPFGNPPLEMSYQANIFSLINHLGQSKQSLHLKL
jgi:hypothetical protein